MNNNMNNKLPGRLIAGILIAATAVACSQQPTVATGPGVETTFDGLVPVNNSRFQYAWVDPEIDLVSYTKIMAGTAEFEFRSVKKQPRTSSIRRGNETEYWISPENRQRLIDEVSAVFEEEVAKSTVFEIVEEPGPDVLIIDGALHDIVSRVPPEHVGRGEVFLSSVGEATLVLRLRDSLSGETIYRAVDRRKAESAGGTTMVRANNVTTWSEVRRLARRWGKRLTDGLDSIHSE